MKKRDLFAELVEGFDALEGERLGKVTLRKLNDEYRPVSEITADEVVRVRAKLNVSRSILARSLRTEEAVIASWEQGRSKSNAQAVILLRLVDLPPSCLVRSLRFELSLAAKKPIRTGCVPCHRVPA